MYRRDVNGPPRGPPPGPPGQVHIFYLPCSRKFWWAVNFVNLSKIIIVFRNFLCQIVITCVLYKVLFHEKIHNFELYSL